MIMESFIAIPQYITKKQNVVQMFVSLEVWKKFEN